MSPVEAASAADLQGVCALLEASGLPTDGLRDHLATTLVARVDGGVAGCVALEVYGSAALLRSLAVTPAQQRRGLGRTLMEAARQLARRQRIATLYLLTTTAEPWFAHRFGFRAIRRDEVPAAVQQSVEFRGACPASARAMRSDVEASPIPATVIFACVHSAGRSQMAAAFLNQLADPARVRGVAAGTEPGARVHPEVVDVMHEIDLDLSGCRPQRLTDELAANAELLVTMGCGEQCPIVPGLRRLDWTLPDPKGQPAATIRAIRDEIRRKVGDLARANGWT